MLPWLIVPLCFILASLCDWSLHLPSEVTPWTLEWKLTSSFLLLDLILSASLLWILEMPSSFSPLVFSGIPEHLACRIVCMLSHFIHVWLLCDPMDCSPPGFSDHGDSPGKNTGVGCHALLQGIFWTQGSNPCLLHFLQWRAGSLPLAATSHRITLYSSWFPELSLFNSIYCQISSMCFE